MREIKFRAWDKFQKCFTDGSMGIRVDGDLFDYEEYNLLQYTGLKDKNGVEIYEGDIVKHPHFKDTDKLQITISDGCVYMGAWDCVRTSFNLCEVIGNIYEHSYLLENNNE